MSSGPKSIKDAVGQPPAFQIWVNDFLGSYRVSQMSGTEVGVFFLLLLLDWQEVGFEFAESSDEVQHKIDRKRLAHWCRVDPRTFDVCWRLVGQAFERRGSRLFNRRLDLERKRQMEWRAKSSAGGQNSAAKRASTTLQPPLKRSPAPTPTPEQGQQEQKTPVADAPGDVIEAELVPVEPKKARETWLTDFGDDWEAACGGKPSYPKLARYLAPLVKMHGAEKVRAHWRNYLAETEAHFASPASFAEKFGSFGPDRKPRLTKRQIEERTLFLSAQEETHGD